MVRPVTFLLGSILGALLVREHRLRRTAERFSAAAMESLLRAIDANDPQTGAHVRRVALYAAAIAEAMGLSDDARCTIELTALFHDVGKIHEALVDIVHDHRRLTRRQRREIRTHPARSADVLAPIAPFHPRLAEAVFAHHERWDGSGYPRRLRGHRIPLAARVVALADTFDAITYRRRYRDGRSVREALAVIRAARGTQFDPVLVDLVTQPRVQRRLERIHRQKVKHGRRLPSRNARPNDVAPKVTFRWRTRTEPPSSVQPHLYRTG